MQLLYQALLLCAYCLAGHHEEVSTCGEASTASTHIVCPLLIAVGLVDRDVRIFALGE
jgi:hypothetical protein